MKFVMGRHLIMSTAGTTSMHLKIHHLGGIRWLRKWKLISRAKYVPQQTRTKISVMLWCWTVCYTSAKMTVCRICIVYPEWYKNCTRYKPIGSQMWTFRLFFAYFSLCFVCIFLIFFYICCNYVCSKVSRGKTAIDRQPISRGLRCLHDSVRRQSYIVLFSPMLSHDHRTMVAAYRTINRGRS